ncbi:response regulator [Thermodesulfobacteriota bacterium]
MAGIKEAVKNKIEILIVEDSPTQARLLEMMLVKNGYKVSVAHSGTEALKHLQSCQPELIITDIVMPEMDGHELCRQIKASEELRGIPILMLTQLSEPEDIIRGLESGADNFITKPYNDKFLVMRIQHIFMNMSLRKESSSQIGMEVYFSGKKYLINSDRLQILDLLISTYEEALQKSQQLEKLNKELMEAIETIKTLQGILPICAHCKKIRDDKGYWNQIEAYIRDHSEAEFSHGICPECTDKFYPDLDL